jgi:hypothetical protein
MLEYKNNSSTFLQNFALFFFFVPKTSKKFNIFFFEKKGVGGGRMEREDILKGLPIEMFVEIFSFFTVKNVLQGTCLVNKLWSAISQGNFLFGVFLKRDFGFVPKTSNLKKTYINIYNTTFSDSFYKIETLLFFDHCEKLLVLQHVLFAKKWVLVKRYKKDLYLPYPRGFYVIKEPFLIDKIDLPKRIKADLMKVAKKIFHDSTKDRRVCIEFAKVNPRFCWVNKYRNDRDFIYEICKFSNGEAFRFCGTRLKNDREFVLSIVCEFPTTLEFAGKFRDDAEIVMASGDIRYASDRLKNDRDFILSIVKIDPNTLKYVNKFRDDAKVVITSGDMKYANSLLKCDREFVLSFIKSLQGKDETWILKEDKIKMSKRFWDDDELVFNCLLCSGQYLEFASNRLKNSKRHVLAAINKSHIAFFFANPILATQDKDILEAIITKCCDSKKLMKKVKELTGLFSQCEYLF